MKQPKPKKEPKPQLLAIHVKEISTNTIICSFPPTKVGERHANRFAGLADIQIIKQYN